MYRRIATIIQRDLISTGRDAILTYIVLAPILLAFGVRFFLPSVGQATINVVLPQSISADLAAHLDTYFHVERMDSEARIHQRVLAFDDAVGIVPDGQGTYRLLLEGNESHDSRVLPAMALQQYYDPSKLVYQSVNVKENIIPYREWVGAFTALSVLFLAAVLMGFHIIEDKETRMLLAMGVTPLTRPTYLFARSLLVLLLAIVMVLGALFALGMTAMNVGQVVAATVTGIVASVLFGLTIGALSSNQIAGVAYIKFGFLLLFIPAILALIIPEKFQPVLYWLPSYWVFSAYRAILVNGSTWSQLFPLLGANLAVSTVLLVAAFPWLRKMLDFNRD